MCKARSLCVSCAKTDEEPTQKIKEKWMQEAATVALTKEDHDEEELSRWPTAREALEELKAIGRIAGPMVMTGLLMYPRAMISMLFLGYLGEMELAGGSLAIGFANITGYSVISGLAMGMEPICGQAYGAKMWPLLGLTLQRTVMLLMCAAVPIGLLWLNMERILLWCGQDPHVTATASIYIVSSLPDLLAQAFLHPIRIYLRSQNVTMPLSYCAAMALALHLPINFLLVIYLKMGITGVALSAVWTNFNLVVSLVLYMWVSGVYKKSWSRLSLECLRGWRTLLRLAIPSCVSVCLEWWWYEFMIILCGLLANPKSTVASMGILIQTTSLVYIFPSSLSFGASTRVGNELGANRPGKARRAMIVSISCAVVMGFLAMAFAVSMRHTWATMFTKDAEIIALTSLVLPIIGICELGNCPQTTGCGVLRGTARPSIGANINLGSFYFVGMPVAIMMGFLFSLDFEGLWLGLLAAQASCVSLMLYVLLRTDWVMQARRAQELVMVASGTHVNTHDNVNAKSVSVSLGCCCRCSSGSLAVAVSCSVDGDDSDGDCCREDLEGGLLLRYHHLPNANNNNSSSCGNGSSNTNTTNNNINGSCDGDLDQSRRHQQESEEDASSEPLITVTVHVPAL